MGNDALFAIVTGGYMLGGFTVLIIVTAILETIIDAIARRR